MANAVWASNRNSRDWSPTSCTACTPKVKYSDIPQDEGRGAILFDMSQKQYWGASKFLYGTNLKNWTSLYADFLSQDDGTAEIVCALGFRYGGTTNGGYSTGTVYFDNVSVVKVTDELFMQEGEHVRLVHRTERGLCFRETNYRMARQSR